jgi:septum formation topological specificity factor MinE
MIDKEWDDSILAFANQIAYNICITTNALPRTADSIQNYMNEMLVADKLLHVVCRVLKVHVDHTVVKISAQDLCDTCEQVIMLEIKVWNGRSMQQLRRKCAALVKEFSLVEFNDVMHNLLRQNRIKMRSGNYEIV